MTSMSKTEIQTAALRNAVENDSVANYGAIFDGFVEKGVDLDDIKPRINVFTYNAWQALGRQVRRGEKGVRVVTVIRTKKKQENGEEESRNIKKMTTVFHISQTDPVEPKAAPEKVETVEPKAAKAEQPQADSKQSEPAKAAVKNANDAHEIGAVFYTSWGYDQTNVDFYEVVAKKGKATLILRPIQAAYPERGDMAGMKIPVAGVFAGGEITVRIGKTGNIKIKGQYGAPAKYTEENGRKIYQAHYYSSYA